MRHMFKFAVAAAAASIVAACDTSGEAQVERVLKDVNVVDATDLNDVMLTVADPNEAVSYFQRASANDPGRVDLMRGLAISLMRATRYAEGVIAWTAVTEHPEATNEDSVSLASALIRSDNWDQAEVVLDSIPPTHETFERYRLEAMVADSNEEWNRADSFYETAVGLTTTPASVLNNWGFSKLTRGDHSGAQRLFEDALRQDPSMFIAKNNLVLSRGAQGQYDLPVIPMTQQERAQLLYTLGLAAVKKGDVTIAKGLFREAIDTSPTHFEAASRALRALENNVTN